MKRNVGDDCIEEKPPFFIAMGLQEKDRSTWRKVDSSYLGHFTRPLRKMHFTGPLRKMKLWPVWVGCFYGKGIVK